MNQTWLRSLVWTDYRLALLFAVIIPLGLLIWSLVKQAEGIQRLLIIYWRVASLLLITIYLLVPAWSIGFITNLLSRILIPISLWFWLDLNEEIRELPRKGMKLAVTSWRWAMTIYCTLSAINTLPFLSCAFDETKNLKTPFCQVWLEAPRTYQQFFHGGARDGFLGFLGMVGLIIYVVYLGYFLLLRLGKQGRSAMEQ